MLIYRESEISVFHYVLGKMKIKKKVKRVWFYLEFGDLCLNNGFIIENEMCAYEIQEGILGVKENENGGKLFYPLQMFTDYWLSEK